MIVVADTGPLNYLVLIEAADVLQPLYTHVVVPETVAGELRSAGAPAAVQAWIAQPPDWLEVRPDPPPDPALRFLLSTQCHSFFPKVRILQKLWGGPPGPAVGTTLSASCKARAGRRGRRPQRGPQD